MSDNVKNPSHYNRGKIEVWEFIEDQGLDYHTGNAVKYIARAGFKDPLKEVEDLQKAIAFLERKIKVLNGTNDINIKITTFQDYAKTLTAKQREFLEGKFNRIKNYLMEDFAKYKEEMTTYWQIECVKKFYQMLLYANLLKDEQIKDEISKLRTELIEIGVF